MAESDRDDRIIGNSDHDVMIGRLIERTAAIQRQAEGMERALNSFGEIAGRLDRTLIQMGTILQNVIKDQDTYKDGFEVRISKIEARVDQHAEYKEDWKFIADVRQKFNKTIAMMIVAGLIVIIASAKVGSLVQF